MRVRFSATGNLRQYLPGPGDSVVVEMPEGGTVSDLLRRLGVVWGEAGIIALNGELAGEESLLHDGDEVEMVAPIGGGER